MTDLARRERRIVVDGGDFAVRGGMHDAFWDLLNSGKWEPANIAALREFLGSGRTLVDIGAWIGPITLIAARLGSEVVAFEPDPVALSELRANLELNPELGERVTVFGVALADFDGEGALSTNQPELGLGWSTSSLLSRPDATAAVTVVVEDVARFLDSDAFRTCALLKMDIEGGEFALVPRMRRYLAEYRPPLLLSIHGRATAGRYERLPGPLRRFACVMASMRQRLPLVVSLVRSYRYWYEGEARGPTADWRPMGRRRRARLVLESRNRELLLTRRPPGVARWRGTSVPVFIISRNRLTPLRALVEWLEAAGYERLIIVDNASTYPPLLEYLASSPHQVVRLEENLGHRSPWESGVVERFALGEWYVVTDPDVLPIPECPLDVVGKFHDILLRYPQYEKAGFGLYIDDLPACYPYRSEVITWEEQFSRRKLERGLYRAPIDTTFALYRPFTRSYVYSTQDSIRTGHPYVVRHSSWYVDPQSLSEEEAYYRETCRPDVNDGDQPEGSERVRVAMDTVPQWTVMDRLRWRLHAMLKVKKER